VTLGVTIIPLDKYADAGTVTISCAFIATILQSVSIPLVAELTATHRVSQVADSGRAIYQRWQAAK